MKRGEADKNNPRPLVRLERNVDSIPIWAPKAYAREAERRYRLPWRGEKAEVVSLASTRYGQLRTTDKLVLTALVDLWHRQGRRTDGIVVFQIMDVARRLGRTERAIGGSTYEMIKESLYRLHTVSLQFIHCFFDRAKEELRSTRSTHILYDLLIVEPRRAAPGAANYAQMTRARINLDVVANLLGHYTRPVSLDLLQRLSGRGVLFEQYINAVLWRRPQITKDVFELWEELGLSTRGYGYGSRLAAKMRRDLRTIESDPDSLLARFSFTASRTRPKSKNLVLYRKDRRSEKTVDEKIEAGDDLTDADVLVERIRFELQDASANDANIRAIARAMPVAAINRGIHEAWGRYRDGLVDNPAAYFVGIMKRRAKELGIDLPLGRR